MVVDVHTHYFRPKLDLTQHLLDDLVRCGVNTSGWDNFDELYHSGTREADVAIVFGLRAAATGWNIPNEVVAAHVKSSPSKLIFFASVDAAAANPLEELVYCHQDLGCCGLKLGPIYQGIHPCDKRCHTLYNYCQKHGLPILFHVGTTFSSGTPLDYSRPSHIDQVAVDFPDLKIIMAHLGHPWEGETIAVIRRNPNVFADLSALYYRPWQFYNSMRLLVEYRAEAKVLFGSDFPFTTTGNSLAGLRGINNVLINSGLPPIPQDIIENIIHRDTLKLLELDDPRKKVFP